MRQYLKSKIERELKDLTAQGILTRNEEGATTFSPDAKIDKDAIKSLREEAGYESILYNYILNTTAANAQMQQLLIGDPLQYYKEDPTTASIKKDLDKNLRKKAVLLHNINIKKGNITNQQNEVKRLAKEYDNLLKEYNFAWGIYDTISTANNQGKRLAGDNASGYKIIANSDSEFYNLLVVDDSEISSSVLDYYYETLVPDDIKALPETTNSELLEKKRAIASYIDKYKQLNQADAQEFSTLEEHLKVMVGRGKITSEEAAQLLEDDNNGKLTFSQFQQVLQPMKLVYSNNFMRDNIDSRLYVKSSSFPLAKTFTKGLPIDRLLTFMQEEGIDRTAFKSAVKIGQPKAKLINII